MLTLSVQLIGQNSKISQAENYFKTFRYAEATPIYQELIQKDNLLLAENELIFRHALISSEKCRDFVFENDVLARLSVSDQYTFSDAYQYFQLNLFLGFTEKAQEVLNSPIVKNTTDARKKLLDQYNGGIIWNELKSDTSRYLLTKVEFNSGKGDFNAIYHPKGIVFSSARDLSVRKSTFDNSSYLNLYLSSKIDGKKKMNSLN